MTFVWWWILLAWPLPWLVLRWRSHTGQASPPASQLLYYPQLTLAQPETVTTNQTRRKPLPLPLVLVWTLLVVAAARPVMEGEPIPLQQQARSMMLAVDLSPSMGEDDMIVNGYRVSRLQAVHRVVEQFIERRKRDRMGLIVFGRQAYLHVPLTFDLETLRTLLLETRIGLAGDRTAIGDAIGLAIKKLSALPAQRRVLVLLTDGANTAGTVDPLEAARQAAQAGIVIHTVGIGTPDVRDDAADLDTLEQIARVTGGTFFNARSAPELEMAYAALDMLEPVTEEGPVVRPLQPLHHWPLLAALLIWLGSSLYRRFAHA